MKNENENEYKKKELKNMLKAPLPKKEFKTFIEHDKTYRDSLREEMEHKIIKLDILSNQCQKVETISKAGITKNIDLLCEFSSLKREIFDLKAKLFSISNLISDKENHYEFVFLPQYEKELAESKAELKETLLKVRALCNSKQLADIHTNIHAEIISKMKMEIEAYDGLDKEERADEERQLSLYKPLKRLLGVFIKTQSEIEDLKKYK